MPSSEFAVHNENAWSSKRRRKKQIAEYRAPLPPRPCLPAYASLADEVIPQKKGFSPSSGASFILGQGQEDPVSEQRESGAVWVCGIFVLGRHPIGCPAVKPRPD